MEDMVSFIKMGCRYSQLKGMGRIKTNDLKIRSKRFIMIIRKRLRSVKEKGA